MNNLQKIKNYCAEHEKVYCCKSDGDRERFIIALPFNDAIKFRYCRDGGFIYDIAYIVGVHPRAIRYDSIKMIVDIVEDIKKISGTK